MWPFKKKPPPITFEQLIADREEPRCGQKKDHYRWILIEGFKCPHCVGWREERTRVRRQQELAEMTADAIVRKLQASRELSNNPDL